jgi:hypothetical protein
VTTNKSNLRAMPANVLGAAPTGASRARASPEIPASRAASSNLATTAFAAFSFSIRWDSMMPGGTPYMSTMIGISGS